MINFIHLQFPRHTFPISILMQSLKRIGKPKIESENKFLTSIKGHNFLLIYRNFIHLQSQDTPSQYQLSDQVLKKIGKGMPKIESENQLLTSIKGHNYVLFCRNLTICNPRTLLPNINSHTKFEEKCTQQSKNEALTDGRTDTQLQFLN